MKHLISTFLLLLMISSAALAGKRSDEVDRLRRATEVFNEIMATPDKGIPSDLLDKAECVGIVPGLKKAGLGLGGKYGRGIVMCRQGKKGWSAPSFVAVEGGSVGFQIGVQSTDLVMLIMNRKGLDKLLGDKFTIGGSVSAAAGPVGRESSANTNVRMDAEILTYSRAKGLFAGVSLDGATFRTAKDSNHDFYGKDVDPRAILLEGAIPLPEEAKALAAALSHESPRKQ